MIYDFSEYSSKADDGNYDVCICGAGAAGITLAWQLSSQGKKVALLEGGGKNFSEESQNIYKGISVGMPYSLESWRLRFLGGTTNHWTGRCRPFTPEDFRVRDFNGLPGWPISFNEMDEYLNGAKEVLGLPISNTFNTLDGTKIESEKVEADKFINSSPVRFGQKYFEYLDESQNVDLFLNANVTNILLEDDHKTVQKILVKSFNDKQAYVKATKFIISMGAIENARLLLNSDTQLTTGLGNATGMVGRCFMEHFNIELGEFVGEKSKWEGVRKMSFFTKPSYSAKNNLAMSNFSFSVVSEYKSYGRTAELKNIFSRLTCSLGVEDTFKFISDHKCLGEGVISTLYEQYPNMSSRVYLDKDSDELGMRKVICDWNMSKQDAYSIRKVAVNMATAFANDNLGRVKLKPYILDDSMAIPVGPHAHQMGTTRMADTYADGVVDRDCKVFGTENLYVAGSSVFSTGGGGNPTMPIIQLTLRLGEHLLSN